jgi:hypothetical protein
MRALPLHALLFVFDLLHAECRFNAEFRFDDEPPPARIGSEFSIDPIRTSLS